MDVHGCQNLETILFNDRMMVRKNPNCSCSETEDQPLHRAGPEVPLWTQDEVCEWVKQIGFDECIERFECRRVDGDLLLQMTDNNLRSSIGIKSELMLKRFMREVHNLKRLADYSSRDSTNLNSFLQTIGPEFSVYTYSMLKAGVDMNTISMLSEDQLTYECGISNSIHRHKILNSIRSMNAFMEIVSKEENKNEQLDAFISYRRSTGSQFASFLQVRLECLGYSVFIDVERLGAGNYDNNLLQSIKRAKNFILVLTSNSLDRCIGDNECKDWVHKEIVAAIQYDCNIIPVTDNFRWPDANALPEDMRIVEKCRGVTWEHDYQDACVDKLEEFMRRNEPDGAAVPRETGPGVQDDPMGSSPSRKTVILSAPNTSLSRRRTVSVRNAGGKRGRSRSNDSLHTNSSENGNSSVRSDWKATCTSSNSHAMSGKLAKSLDLQSVLDQNNEQKINFIENTKTLNDYFYKCDDISKSMYDLINESTKKKRLVEKCQRKMKSILRAIF